jgi:hypothetical protein
MVVFGVVYGLSGGGCGFRGFSWDDGRVVMLLVDL